MLLPVEELYAPSLACRVFDKIFKGYEGALIGTFSIPIGQIMFDQRKEFEQNMLDLDVIIDELEKIRDGILEKSRKAYRKSTGLSQKNRKVEKSELIFLQKVEEIRSSLLEKNRKV